jgi:hypothetical protein
MYIAEAGYAYGDTSAEPRILRVLANGKLESVVEGEPLVGPVNDLLWHEGRMFVSHRGKVSLRTRVFRRACARRGCGMANR